MADQIKQQSLELMLKQSLSALNKNVEEDKEDEERVNLISGQEPSELIEVGGEKNKKEVEEIVENQEQVIDPISELVKNKNVLPLLAVLEHLDLNMDIDGKPLLSRLCTMNIPLKYHLKNRQIIFTNDKDNRTALHDAIAADDILSANWCIQNKIGNIKDNFCNTPLIQAIKLGRKNAFLLLLHYQYYDSQAPHICATYNRLWQLKVLERLGYDIVSVRDSQHFSPIERAVANYSYEVAEYLTQISDNVSPGYLSNKTQSKAIIRIIKRVIDKKSMAGVVVPFLQLFIHFIIVFLGIGYFKIYQAYAETLYEVMVALVLAYIFLFGFGMQKESSQRNRRVNLMQLLKAPQFPVLEDICPQTLQFYNPNKQYCPKSKESKERYHFYGLTCVSKNNQIFWFIIEILWFAIAYTLNQIVINRLTYDNLMALNFSDSNFLFRNAVWIEILYKTNKEMVLWFIYVKVLMIYQSFCLFQWLCMLVLDRTYQEINNTHKYKKLYRVVQTKEGGYKHQEKRLLEHGIVKGFMYGAINVVLYFFK